MSRVGRKVIPLPKGVALNITKTEVSVKGPKGELKRALPTGVSIKVSAGESGQEALVEPFVDYGKLDEVLIVLTDPPVLPLPPLPSSKGAK